MSSLRPNTNKGHDLGSSTKQWNQLHVDDVKSRIATFSGDVTVQGNLTVEGSQVSLTELIVDDPLFKIGNGNTADTIDLGFYAVSNNGTTDEYHGLARDHDDSKFYLFEGVGTQPTTTLPDVSANTATLVANLEGAVTGNASSASILETARTIEISGDVAGQADFDGSAAINISAVIQEGAVDNSMLAGSIADGKLASDYIQTSEVDDSSIEWDATHLQVKALGITNAMLAGSIENAKLSNSSVSFGGVSVALGASDDTPAFDLQDATNLPTTSLTGTISDAQLAQDYVQITEVDDSSIEWDGVDGHLQVKALGITNAMLAGSIENAKLSNSSVSFGGVSVSLGASDATPAFDLQDATNLPTTSLTGTISDAQLAQDYIQTSEVDDSSIEFAGGTLNVKALGVTNAMLAGSIENAKLSNNTVSFGGVQLTLGGSDASPAFDLSDATNYPTAQLVGDVADSQLAEDYIKTSEVDGASIEFAGGSLNVKALGVTNDMLAGSIVNAKLVNDSVSLGGVSVDLGASVTQPAFDLTNATNYPALSLTGQVSDTQLALDYIQVTEVDDSSIEWSGTALNVKALGVTNAMLAGSIENAKLSNSTVSYGGVQISLGGSDATPAFDLSDATNYPTTALVGTITNDQLAGSIANSKLVNSSISFTDGAATSIRSLGDTIQINGTSNEVSVELDAGTNAFTISLPDVVAADISGTAADATILETARDFSIDSTEMSASAVSFNGGANVQLVPSLKAGSVANSKLANSSITVADVSGNSEAIALGDTLYFGGTSSEIEVTYSTQLNKFTIGLPNSVVISTNLECGGQFTAGSITTTGNLNAAGLTASGANVTFADTLLEVGLNNTDLKDIGFYGQRGDGLGSSNGFAGFAYDESQDRFMTFKASTEPTTTVGAHTLAELQVGGLNVNSEYDLPSADGTDGQVMTTDGNGNVTFESLPASELSFANIFSVAGSSPLGLSDQSTSTVESIVVYVGNDAGNATATLPTTSKNGYKVTLKNKDTLSAAWKYQPPGGATIEGATGSASLLAGESLTFVYNSGTWYKIARFH